VILSYQPNSNESPSGEKSLVLKHFCRSLKLKFEFEFDFCYCCCCYFVLCSIQSSLICRSMEILRDDLSYLTYSKVINFFGSVMFKISYLRVSEWMSASNYNLSCPKHLTTQCLHYLRYFMSITIRNYIMP
jgi:hypothetical protein